MSRDGLRVLGPAIAAIAAILGAALATDWFVAHLTGVMELSKISFDLREARACTSAGVCGVVPMSMIKGSAYPTLATATFWGSFLFAALVAYQAGTRAISGFANESITRAAHGVGVLVLITAVCAGYLFGPSLTPGQMMGVGLDVDRGWGPILMIGGLLIGQVALYFAGEATSEVTTHADPLPVARARVPMPLETPPAGLPSARSKEATRPPPVSVQGKIKFAIVTGELSAAGIDARREDGTSVLVMWRDVVGLVARALPPELEGHPFVDIISTAGMTVRVLPWSKLTGERIEGEGDARMRAFVKLVKPRCPEAKVDRATQEFVDGATPQAPRLTTLELLAKHDQALA